MGSDMPFSSLGKLVDSYRQFDCGIHDIKYKSFTPGCPACDQERTITSLRVALQTVSSQLEVVSKKSQELQAQVDMVSSMRDAIPLLDESDTGFLKLSLYMYRDEKSVALRPTRGGKRGAVIGFIRMSRRDEPFAHHCASVGGLAIAEYLNEAINTYGQPKAMEIMTRALSPILPGSLS